MTSPLFAEPLIVRPNVNGPECNHVGIYNAQGDLVFITTMDELNERFSSGDSPVMIQLKTQVQTLDIKDVSVFKTVIESQSFAVDAFDPKKMDLVNPIAVDPIIDEPAVP